MRFLLMLLLCISLMGFKFIGGIPPLEEGTSEPVIFDDFSTDTSADYWALKGGIAVASGVATGSSAWSLSFAYQKITATGNDDHYVRGDIMRISNDESGLMLRCNGIGGSSTGYYAKFDSNTKLTLWRFVGNVSTLVGDISNPLPGSKSLSSTVAYDVKVTISGDTFNGYVDWNEDGDFNDTDEDLGFTTDSTYTTGAYVGLVWDRTGANNDPTVDNLAGGLL